MKIHSYENNPESQLILDFNRKRLSNQCEVLLQAFNRGERLTVKTALLQYGIGSLPRRVLAS